MSTTTRRSTTSAPRTATRRPRSPTLGTDAAKADAAALNKAWNVLSDPYQRGRYDQQRADGELDVDDDDDDDDDDDGAAPVRRPSRRERPTRRGRRRTRAEAARRREADGHAARRAWTSRRTRRRLIAMFIDLAMLLVLFIAQPVPRRVSSEKSQHPTVYHRGVAAEHRRRSPTGRARRRARAKKRRRRAEKSKGANAPETQTARPTAARPTRREGASVDSSSTTQLTDGAEGARADSEPRCRASFFLVSLLVLLDPEPVRRPDARQAPAADPRRARRRLAGARPATCSAATRVLVFAAYVLSSFLRSPVGALIVVFVATMWTRNPNQQGLQDRFAKTLVVTDDAE